MRQTGNISSFAADFSASPIFEKGETPMRTKNLRMPVRQDILISMSGKESRKVILGKRKELMDRVIAPKQGTMLSVAACGKNARSTTRQASGNIDFANTAGGRAVVKGIIGRGGRFVSVSQVRKTPLQRAVDAAVAQSCVPEDTQEELDRLAEGFGKIVAKNSRNLDMEKYRSVYAQKVRDLMDI